MILIVRLAAETGSPARSRHIPLAALRVMSLLAGPVAPAFARQAQAAVVMNTTDMTACHDCTPASKTTISQLLRERDHVAVA